MRYGIILHPDPRHAEPRGESWRLDERRAAGIERKHGLTVERQPLAVAPQRRGARGDRVTGRKHARCVEDGIERAEALLAYRDGGRLV